MYGVALILCLGLRSRTSVSTPSWHLQLCRGLAYGKPSGGLIPSPETGGRILLVLDDSIITKVGKKIFGCEAIFDHAAKSNQSKYPWAQNIVSVGLLKQIKGRWACLFLDFRFYLPLKTIQAKKETATIRGTVVPFQTKMTQAGDRVIGIAEHFSISPILAVTDS